MGVAVFSSVAKKLGAVMLLSKFRKSFPNERGIVAVESGAVFAILLLAMGAIDSIGWGSSAPYWLLGASAQGECTVEEIKAYIEQNGIGQPSGNPGAGNTGNGQAQAAGGGTGSNNPCA